jgi:hypothetical protein
LIATFHDQDLDLLLNALSENKVLEFVEIDGVHLTNDDIHLIQLNKQSGFKFRGHDIVFDMKKYTE